MSLFTLLISVHLVSVALTIGFFYCPLLVALQQQSAD